MRFQNFCLGSKRDVTILLCLKQQQHYNVILVQQYWIRTTYEFSGRRATLSLYATPDLHQLTEGNGCQWHYGNSWTRRDELHHVHRMIVVDLFRDDVFELAGCFVNKDQAECTPVSQGDSLRHIQPNARFLLVWRNTVCTVCVSLYQIMYWFGLSFFCVWLCCVVFCCDGPCESEFDETFF